MTKNTTYNRKIIIVISIIILFTITSFFLLFNNSLYSNSNNKNYNEGYKSSKYKSYDLKTTQNTSNKKIVKPYKVYYCNAKDMKLEGNKCYYDSIYDATVTYRCSQGYPDYSTGNCVITTLDSEYNEHKSYVPAEKQYICGGDYAVSGSKCVKTYSVLAFEKLTCPNGYRLVNNQCIPN